MADRVAAATAGATPTLVRVALLATVAELVLLGSGRLLPIGPLTVRMWLFAAGVGYALVYALRRRRVDAELSALVLYFVVTVLFGAELGLVRGAPLAQVAEDVKPLAFFLSIGFFAAAISTTADVRHVAAAIRWGAVALAASYLALLGAVVAGLVPFARVYALFDASGEIFFRGESGFFYKGFLYLGIGIFFWAFARGVRGKVVAAILFTALALTFTRGLLLATALVLVTAVVLRQRNVLASAGYLGVIAAAAAAALPLAFAAFSDRAASDAIRLNDVREVLQGTTWWSVVVGHGLGVSIGSRERIEATYLQILFQQGLVGLTCWGIVLALLTRDYVRARRAGQAAAAEPFFLGALFVYLESATNPFLTNPIGMSMVLLSLVCLRVLARGDATAGATARALS